MRIGFYNENSAHNAMYALINDVRFYFSYNTLVGIQEQACEPVVVQNQRGGTTGKHLNWIDNKGHKTRLCQKDFDKRVREICKKHKIKITDLPTLDII